MYFVCMSVLHLIFANCESADIVVFITVIIIITDVIFITAVVLITMCTPPVHWFKSTGAIAPKNSTLGKGYPANIQPLMRKFTQ